MGFLERESLPYLVNALEIWLLLRGIILWTIWVERNDLTFHDNMWDIKNTKQTVWQGLLDYAKIAWEIARKEVSKATSTRM